MRRILPALAVAALLSVSACSSDNPPPVAAATAASMAPAVDAAAAEACQQNKAAKDGDKLIADGVAQNIADAARQADSAEIQTLGATVFDRYREAVLAEGTEDEFSTQANLLTASINLQTECILAGHDEG